jgi:hypothetical protein
MWEDEIIDPNEKLLAWMTDPDEKINRWMSQSDQEILDITKKLFGL